LKKNKIIIVQPGIPSYRIDFFSDLNNKLGDNRLSVYADHHQDNYSEDIYTSFQWHKMAPVYNFPILNLFWQKNISGMRLQNNSIVVLFGNPRYLSNIILFIRCKYHGIKIIWWTQLRSHTSSSFGTKIRLFFAKKADAILFYTYKEHDDFLKKNSVQSAVGYLNNGISTKEIIRYRKKYIFSERKRNVIFLGRLIEKTKLDVLLRAIANLDTNNIHINIVGDGPMLKEYQEIALKLGIHKSVSWLGDVRQEKHLAEIFNRSAIMIYPGAIGLALIHSFAYGVPVITHNNNLNHGPEFTAIKHAINSMTFKEGHIDSLTQTIKLLINDEKALTGMSHECIRLVDKTFNTFDMCERFLDIIES
jgi:glycosyltransferase involved in cell wall biosynthesis